MKLVSYRTADGEHLGIFQNEKVYNLAAAASAAGQAILPDDMNSFLRLGERAMNSAKTIDVLLKKG